MRAAAQPDICCAANNESPFWPPPVTLQPYHTESVWWRNRSNVPGGLGLSFHSGPLQSAGEQQTAGWRRPVPELWRSSRPGEGKIMHCCPLLDIMELKAAACFFGKLPCGRAPQLGPYGFPSPRSSRQPPSCPPGYWAEPSSSAGHPGCSPVKIFRQNIKCIISVSWFCVFSYLQHAFKCG